MAPIEIIALPVLVGYAIHHHNRTKVVPGPGRFTQAILYAIAGACWGISVGPGAAAYALLAIGVVASVAVGALRARYVRVWRSEGHVYHRGSGLTTSLFLALVAFELALGQWAHWAGIPYGGGFGVILLMDGVMLAVQAELVWRRGRRSLSPRPLYVGYGRRRIMTPTTFDPVEKGDACDSRDLLRVRH